LDDSVFSMQLGKNGFYHIRRHSSWCLGEANCVFSWITMHMWHLLWHIIQNNYNLTLGDAANCMWYIYIHTTILNLDYWIKIEMTINHFTFWPFVYIWIIGLRWNNFKCLHKIICCLTYQLYYNIFWHFTTFA
jgi:hypothetical protein